MITTANSAATQRLVRIMADHMSSASIDETVHHPDLRRLLPQERQRDYYFIVARARGLLNQESGTVFATVTREGYRRLAGITGAEYEGKRSLSKVRRTVRRGQRFVSNALHHANDATPRQRREVYQNLAALGIIEHLTMARTVKTMPDEPRAPEDGLAGLRAAIGA